MAGAIWRHVRLWAPAVFWFGIAALILVEFSKRPPEIWPAFTAALACLASWRLQRHPRRTPRSRRYGKMLLWVAGILVLYLLRPTPMGGPYEPPAFDWFCFVANTALVALWTVGAAAIHPEPAVDPDVFS